MKMAKDKKKKSKGPQDRNSNYQLKNGNSVSGKKGKNSESCKPVGTKASGKAQAKPSGQKGFMSGITNSITKMLRHQ
ncbi:MAG: hypothetical protein A4E44_01767 [Methanosaeta sp. PtaB.Bin018]|jgi:hypothetical protein|nr:hypothetical protein [Methanothrix sp.]OPX74749.1 MAG: hypothetical protein A4E44_01767 [Methanosaeta sp. PtaB.Bin018]OPY47316.1 MAG: hypothetical protein A4E46_00477 [Methanosaeta sp. PtaU1.Bin016]